MNITRPLITVILPTYNSAATVERALQSLADQTWRGFEVLLQDGASRDDTLAIARTYETQVPHLRIASAADRGVYDAINRAWAAANGEWVLVLGSDDRLHAPDTLALMAPLLKDSVSAAIVYGDVQNMGPGTVIGPVGTRYAGPMPLERLLRHNICQQAVFYRSVLREQVGVFDLRYPVWADWDFNVRVAFRAQMRWVDVIVSDYCTAGMSSTHTGDAFAVDVSTMALREFVARIGDRTLWPAWKHLLRWGNQRRKSGRWGPAILLWWSYLALLCKRWTFTAHRTLVKS